MVSVKMDVMTSPQSSIRVVYQETVAAEDAQVVSASAAVAAEGPQVVSGSAVVAAGVAPMAPQASSVAGGLVKVRRHG